MSLLYNIVRLYDHETGEVIGLFDLVYVDNVGRITKRKTDRILGRVVGICDAYSLIALHEYDQTDTI